MLTSHGRGGQPSPILPFVPQTADALPVELQYLDDGHALHRMGLHGHTFFELVFIERGGGEHRIGSQSHPAGAGDIFIIPPGELHDCNALGPSAAGWVLLFTHEALDGAATVSRAYAPYWPSCNLLLSPFLTRAQGRGMWITTPEADRTRWSERFALMAGELGSRGPGYRFAVQAHLTLVLLDLLRLVSASHDMRIPDAADPLLKAAFDFIEGHYARAISVRDVARAVRRSTAHLTTAMRLRTGLTAGDWIAERRMAEARRLLVSTEFGLDEIADRSGYSGPDAFARAFRRSHRLSPAAWRQAHRGNPPYA